MEWHTVATASSLEGLQAKVPDAYQYVPAGKRTKIIMNTSPFPVAPIFDLAGAEFAAQLLQKGGKLIDVQGNGWFEIEFEIESTGSASMGQDGGAGEADMAALPAVVVWIGVIVALVTLAPLVTKVATLMANYVPSTGDGDGGGIIDYFKALFGDYTPYVLIGGALVLALWLWPQLTGGRRRSEG